MLNFLCIVLVAVGPWIGPAWPEVSFVPDSHREDRISACPSGEIRAIGSPITPDIRTTDAISATVAGRLFDPPAVVPGRDLLRSALPQPTRVFLITAHASSFL